MCRIVHGGEGLCLWESCCTVWGRGGREQKECLALKPWYRPGGEAGGELSCAVGGTPTLWGVYLLLHSWEDTIVR